MPTPFAALQDRVNDAVVAHLANKTFVIKGVDVDGSFDNEFVMVEFVETKKPVFTCKSADVVGVVHGDTVVSGSENYKIQGMQPDGKGMIKLILEKQ